MRTDGWVLTKKYFGNSYELRVTLHLDEDDHLASPVSFSPELQMAIYKAFVEGGRDETVDA